MATLHRYKRATLLKYKKGLKRPTLAWNEMSFVTHVTDKQTQPLSKNSSFVISDTNKPPSVSNVYLFTGHRQTIQRIVVQPQTEKQYTGIDARVCSLCLSHRSTCKNSAHTAFIKRGLYQVKDPNTTTTTTIKYNKLKLHTALFPSRML